VRECVHTGVLREASAAARRAVSVCERVCAYRRIKGGLSSSAARVLSGTFHCRRMRLLFCLQRRQRLLVCSSVIEALLPFSMKALLPCTKALFKALLRLFLRVGGGFDAHSGSVTLD
jgi:hypothetical protein